MRNNSVLQNGELLFPNGRNLISRYFFTQKPKCHLILFQCTNVYLCAKCGDLKPTIDEIDVLKFGPVSEQGAETRFQKETAIFFRPNVSKC